ncbi:MAG: DUF2634 domain-containing protein [Fusobacterium mortiferum]|jgi:hypothetical protein|uniref:DUF2634 domain-containing protein n=1 Tax=Fusobacterium mortiferum ATCC 9817 TaxID=469616 RepID=A0ABN5J8D0_FUSMR|nr:DUF2634 domain-containing protein [Fusobacterium mortiferum]DAJ46196.1 MAG TPA: Protein of unknown function (DUF2634) [Caudoviricetes sp.]AVQ18749.1 DUF2634 domain-containing protein [Fusobacterium mortiferum ATCC 9817]EEO34986.1 hypothetical protein FMAG_00548 [Fusobacterium mortiferum ATCC 9817]MCF2628347.1 DUF2634 domain-containing protein [Fusobacterium mortiferum]MCI7188093.1 DUF2634 domain-containing protein [Fusobacterium mortiferum]
MSIFPKSFNTISSVTVTNSKTLINKYKDLLFDTTTKKVIVKDGKTEFTDKKKQVQQWIFLLLHTEMEKYKVYQDTEFGIRFLYEMRGNEFYSSGFTIAQIKDELEEKLLLNKNIQSVESINITKNFNSLVFDIVVIVNDELIKSEVELNV